MDLDARFPPSLYATINMVQCISCELICDNFLEGCSTIPVEPYTVKTNK